MPQKNLFIDVEEEKTDNALSDQEYEALKNIAKRNNVTLKALSARIFRDYIKNYGMVKFAKHNTKDKK
jgi:predicted DNA-binding ribbon-helix-helix protein